MKNSSGLLIIKDNKILLAHPTNHPWTHSYTIPKGNIEVGETKIDAAIRETFEEVGITISEDFIDKTEYLIEYRNKKNKLYKRLYYFIVFIDNYDDVLNKNKLQLDEVDWAGFLTKKEAEEKIFWRFKPMLDFLDYSTNL